jgi:membrane protease YdiL (CAAX protease family)
MRVIDARGEARVALAFALAYVALSGVTGLVQRARPLPLLGATLLTSDAWYALGYKIGLLLVVPLVALHRAGYRAADLLPGWRATPGSILKLLAAFGLGFLLNAGKLDDIRVAAAALPGPEAMGRIALGGGLMLFTAGLPEEIVYRGVLQTRLELLWGRVAAVLVTALLFTAWHLPSRYLLASGAEGTAGDLGSVLLGTGLPVLIVALIFGVAWDRWRNLPVLIALHWGIDVLPSVASFLRLPPGTH